jgi:hypothetical protein
VESYSTGVQGDFAITCFHILIHGTTADLGIVAHPQPRIVAQERKMVWNSLWNPIQRVHKGVATTCFHDNYPGSWSVESQRTFEWTHSTDGNKYTQNWYTSQGLWHKNERWFGTGCGILFNCCTRGLPKLVFRTTIQEPGQ